MQKLFLPIIVFLCLAVSCTENDKPVDFVVDVTQTEFLESVSRDVPFRSGNGTYTVEVISGKDVLTATIVTGEHPYGAVRFDPIKPGKAVVEVRDVVADKTARIEVTVQELVFILNCMKTNATNDLSEAVNQQIKELMAFDMGGTYYFSARDGIIYRKNVVYEKLYDTSFAWNEQAGELYLQIPHEGLTRSLKVNPDENYPTGYNLFVQYAMRNGDYGTRDSQPALNINEVVIFTEDLSHYFSDTGGDVHVTATYEMKGGPAAKP